MPPTHIFLSACLFALIAAVATGLLSRRGAQTERMAEPAPSPTGA